MAAWTPGSDRGAGGPYPTADAYGAFDQGAQYDAPKKKVDAIAEAWGIHEPEPFEEFNAGGGRGDTPTSSIYNDREGRSRRNDEPRSRAAGKRSLPPPQPIFISDSVGEDDVIAGTPGGGMPKRSKSLMQRIKKMRDSPNVPVDSDYQSAPGTPDGDEPRASRPTHRTQNSFLGRFNKPESPTEPFILVDAQTNKNLPSVPYGGTPGSPSSPRDDYFDRANGSRDTQSPGAVGSPGLGRKTSLMKRMKGVVRNL